MLPVLELPYMLIHDFIFDQIKNTVPALTSGSITAVYPQVLPKGSPVNLAVIYNQINSGFTFNTITATFQLTCVSTSYTECANLALTLATLFSNKVFMTVGDPVSSNTLEIIELPYDNIQKVYTQSVTIVVKSRKHIEQYL